ncbi:GFA family protein [Paracoccus luteus]|uniref:GFA family protein n=1 Tax=Paracoccus luteus TaxID=2508543 RepID=UPI00106F25B1|nr:GFA family protein [Paracoccus luteus]
MNGHCICGAVTYQLTDAPLFVQCCHCSWCQRETGSAFAVNALIETDRVVIDGPLREREVPTASGKGQVLVQCAQCGCTILSHYAGAGRKMAFLRTGTLDDPGALPPAIHIYVGTRRPWVILPDGVPASDAYYRAADHWSPAALARRQALR